MKKSGSGRRVLRRQRQRQVWPAHGVHLCWKRPEDMDNPRSVYAITKDRPGSKVAAETAAALAASADYLLAAGLRLQLPPDPGAADQRHHGPPDVVEPGMGLGGHVGGVLEHCTRPVVVGTYGEERLPVVFIYLLLDL